MGQKAEYRSAVRSRENIRRAYAELIHEQGTLKIKVKDLVQRADVNRSTFYAHYRDTDAVLEEIENQVMREMFAVLDRSQYAGFVHDPLPFLAHIGAELERNKGFYRLLVETTGSVAFTAKLKDIFLERMRADRRAYGSVKRQREFLVCMNLLAGGAVGVYCDWITGKIDMPMRELVKIINDMVLNALSHCV